MEQLSSPINQFEQLHTDPVDQEIYTRMCTSFENEALRRGHPEDKYTEEVHKSFMYLCENTGIDPLLHTFRECMDWIVNGSRTRGLLRDRTEGLLR